jgi:UDP-N-acetylmuramate: L-alanyl-gamma-D-glutamyl-meso-diaminopimelate ligase
MKLHLIGIAGTGMGSLAGLLRAAGHDVRGSDEHVYPPMSTQLAEQNIPVMEGFGPANLDWAPDRVVVGNVCRRDHVEVLAATERRIPLVSFPALLSELFLTSRRSVVVAGTHGKTTTSSLMSFVLAQAGRDPSFLIGGVPVNFRQSWHLGTGPEFVVEGDEYDTAFFDKKSKFLHYQPQVVILTSVEFDHADIFADEAAVKDAFREFIALIPPEGHLVVCAASPGAMEVARAARCGVTSYGRPGSDADWTFEVTGRKLGGRTILRLACAGKVMGNLDVGMAGIFNLENLTGVIAAAHVLGVEQPAVTQAIRHFLGVRRRQEIVGVAAGVTVVDDFAHHPTAIRETLGALKGRYGPGKLIVAFEPRSATSRRSVFQLDFVDALAVADEVVLAPAYASEKVPAAERLDVERLAADLRSHEVPARLVSGVPATVEHLASRAAPGDTVVIMSSGDFGGLHDKLLQRLGDPVRSARAQDREAIGHLLSRVGITHADLDRSWPSFLVIPAPDETVDRVAACVAIEPAGDDALLRLLAVAPERRGEGLGYLLLENAMRKARAEGALHLYLVTDGTQGLVGEKLGFDVIDRKDVASAVAASNEYQMARSKTAMWMRKEL